MHHLNVDLLSAMKAESLSSDPKRSRPFDVKEIAIAQLDSRKGVFSAVKHPKVFTKPLRAVDVT